jgi:rhodanese-related sulfurtransferase
MHPKGPQPQSRVTFVQVGHNETAGTGSGKRLTIEAMLSDARSGLSRLTPHDLCAVLTRPDVVVLDTRTPTDRDRFGCIPGSVHAPRTLMEFMVDPDWGYQHPAIDGFDQVLVCVCNGGYSSSLAAASLQRLGFRNATDLIGGMVAWTQAGFPVVAPDHLQFD